MHTLGGLSNDDVEGSKVNSPYFKIHHPYSKSFYLLNGAEFLWEWNLSFEKESQNRCLVCSRPAQNVKLGIFTS